MASNDDAELRRDDIQPLGDILADAMQATAAAADQAFRLDHLFHMGKMLRKGAAIGRARVGDPVPRRSVCLVLGMDRISGGWGARIRTWECRYQKPVPYRLATPQQRGDIRSPTVVA